MIRSPAGFVDLNRYIGLAFEEANCWQLYRRIAQEVLGLAVPDYDGFCDDPLDRACVAAAVRCCAAAWEPVANGAEVFGDAAVIWVMGRPCHIGFVIGGGRMIHASRGSLSNNVSYREHAEWSRWRRDFYRFRA